MKKSERASEKLREQKMGCEKENSSLIVTRIRDRIQSVICWKHVPNFYNSAALPKAMSFLVDI